MSFSDEINSRILTDFDKFWPLGSGGFGVVVKAKNKLDGVGYALKIAFDESKYQIGEVTTFAKIKPHVNLVSYKTAWKDVIRLKEIELFKDMFGPDFIQLLRNQNSSQFNIFCIQMELCSGDLKKWIKGCKSISEKTNLSIYKQICNGLDFLHEQKFIHRDLKPANIFFDLFDPSLVKIGDFGIAVEFSQDTNIYRTSIGTKTYWAPEQESGKYGPQVDIYSIGIILLEIFLAPNVKTFEEFSKVVSDMKFTKMLPHELDPYPKVSQVILSLTEYKPNDRMTLSDSLELLDLIKVSSAPNSTTNPDIGNSQQIFFPNFNSDIVHTDVVCKGCGMNPIQGNLFRCLICVNIDFCEICQNKAGIHLNFHPLVKYTSESHYINGIWKLKLGDNNQENKPYHQLTCKVCGMTNFYGNLYRCSEPKNEDCKNFDSCAKCYSINPKIHAHSLIKIAENSRYVGKVWMTETDENELVVGRQKNLNIENDQVQRNDQEKIEKEKIDPIILLEKQPAPEPSIVNEQENIEELNNLQISEEKAGQECNSGCSTSSEKENKGQHVERKVSKLKEYFELKEKFMREKSMSENVNRNPIQRWSVASPYLQKKLRDGDFQPNISLSEDENDKSQPLDDLNEKKEFEIQIEEFLKEKLKLSDDSSSCENDQKEWDD